MPRASGLYDRIPLVVGLEPHGGDVLGQHRSGPDGGGSRGVTARAGGLRPAPRAPTAQEQRRGEPCHEERHAERGGVARVQAMASGHVHQGGPGLRDAGHDEGSRRRCPPDPHEHDQA
jgi:hypothetical protein